MSWRDPARHRQGESQGWCVACKFRRRFSRSRSCAPGVGTTVLGGATYREAHLVMELLHDSGLVRSVDIVELNPFLDERDRTARVVVELTGSLFGQQIKDRPTPSTAIELGE